MFVCSIRFHRERAALCCALLIGAAAVFGLAYGRLHGPGPETAVSAAVSGQKVQDNEDRVEFLSAFGWEVEEEPESIEEIVVPEEFSQVFEKYNQVQKLQGYDLEKQKGKRVKRYTYVVKNYPNEPDYVRANILVCKEKVVGGDICSLRAEGGFLHGFTLAEDTVTMAPFSAALK